MAIVNIKSSSVTNADSTTQANTRTKTAGGRVKEIASTVEVTNGESIDSVYRLGRVHSSWRISQIIRFCDAITGAIADFGLHDTAANGGAIVDRDFFASANSLAAADVAGLDVTHESAAAAGATQDGDVANIEKTLWEVLGLSADPNKYYDLTAMLTAAATATGTLAVLIRYVDGN